MTTRVALVTDSGACLPAWLADTLGIRVLPITVHLSGSDRLDGDDGLPQQVYQALDHDQPVKSSPPSAADYLAAIEDIDAAGVVVVTPAAEFTAMCSHASLACELSAGRAVMVDSRTTAAAQGLVVWAGAEVAAAGGTRKDVVRGLEAASSRVDLVGALARLGPLRSSGRVSSPGLEGEGGPGARALFRMRGGAVESLSTVASAEAALAAIQEEWSRAGASPGGRTIVFHADCPDLAGDLAGRLAGVELVTSFSAAMGIYTGRGVVGAAWLPPPA